MFRPFAPLCAKSLARRPHRAVTLDARIARPNQADKAEAAQMVEQASLAHASIFNRRIRAIVSP
jgi:hypothetical protein